MGKLFYPSIDFHEDRPSMWTEVLHAEFEDMFRKLQDEWPHKRPSQGQIGYPLIRDLYKYRTFDPKHPERTEVIFSKNTLWASSISQLNDPLEAAFVAADTDGMLADTMNWFVNTRWHGCVCFTWDPVCVQMWAHYSDNHSGFCIAYRRYDSFLLCSNNCRPVNYARSIPSLAESLSSKDSWALEVFWTKFEAWEYEREWRLMYPRANAYVPSGLLITWGVIFGLRTPEETKRFLRQCAKEVRFGQIERTKSAYGLRVRWEDENDR